MQQVVSPGLASLSQVLEPRMTIPQNSLHSSEKERKGLGEALGEEW